MFQDLIHDRIRELNPSMGGKKIFSLSLALAVKLARRNWWLQLDREPTLQFSSVVRSLMRHSSYATEPWERKYLADINFYAGNCLCSHMWTAQGCIHYGSGFELWNKLPKPNPNRLLNPAENYGLSLIQEGDYKSAEKYLSQAYTGLKRLERDESAKTLRVKYHQLHLLQAQGFPHEAERIATRMLKPSQFPFWASKIGPRKRIELNHMLAHFARDQGRYRHALAILEAAVDELQQKEIQVLMGKDADINLVSNLQTVALVHMNLGNYIEADRMARTIISGTSSGSILKSILGADFEPTRDEDPPASKAFLERIMLNAQINIGASLVEQEQYQDAVDYTDQVIKTVEERGHAIGTGDSLVLTEVNALARALAGESLTAEEDFKYLCKMYERQEEQGFYPQGAIRAREGLALARGLGGDVKAKAEFEKAIALSKQYLAEKHPDLYTTYHRLGMVLEYQGEMEEAMRWYGKAFKGKVDTLGADHPLTVQSDRAWSKLQQNIEPTKAEPTVS
ncbi:hypothetical protein EDB80DRAFT_690306 [Ilyonectria destructans]|nr:hypothetical protein EDB80DRAFT_690306 [Ilyonectria destructans]